MNYVRLIFYPTLILFASYRLGFCEQFEYEFELEQVCIDGILNASGTEDKIWERVNIAKYYCRDRFVFQNHELDGICDGLFTSTHVEIVEVFGRVIRLSLIRGSNQWWINCLFAEQRAARLFFEDIRKRQTYDCGRVYKFDKLLQYRVYDPQNPVERLQLLCQSGGVYFKNIDSISDIRPKTINFASYQRQHPSTDIYLVLQSKTFNISKEILHSNVYILCASNMMSTQRFILKFSSRKSIFGFFAHSSIASDLNPEIPCPTDWLTMDILQQVNSL